MRIICICAVGLCAALSLAQPGPALDQNKLNDVAGLGFFWWFTDADGDTWHDAGEVLSPVFQPAGRVDMSCWMASAANMLQYEGFGNPYVGSLTWGGAWSPNVSSWGNVFASGAGDGFMTFDDGGWQHWAIAFAGVGFIGPIVTLVEFGMGPGAGWGMNPITWSQARLAEDHPVGLTIWNYDMYHAITLWDIVPTDPANGVVYITDSDDRAMGGLRPVPYTWNGSDWNLINVYPGMNALINYAVAIPEPAVFPLALCGLGLLRRR